MCQSGRRHFIGRLALGGIFLTPLAVALSGCRKDNWPEGMTEIRWDRTTCQRCGMVISDSRFAAEIVGGPNNTAFIFDDVGCLVFWLRDKAAQYPWLNDAATRLWVADSDSPGRDKVRWFDPRQVHYAAKSSPMAYNFGAVGSPLPGSVDFNEMRRLTLAKGK